MVALVKPRLPRRPVLIHALRLDLTHCTLRDFIEEVDTHATINRSVIYVLAVLYTTTIYDVTIMCVYV